MWQVNITLYTVHLHVKWTNLINKIERLETKRSRSSLYLLPASPVSLFNQIPLLPCLAERISFQGENGNFQHTTTLVRGFPGIIHSCAAWPSSPLGFFLCFLFSCFFFSFMKSLMCFSHTFLCFTYSIIAARASSTWEKGCYAGSNFLGNFDLCKNLTIPITKACTGNHLRVKGPKSMVLHINI